MKNSYNKKILVIFFLFFLTSLTTINSQEISIFDIARKGTLEQLKKAEAKDSNVINMESKEGYTPLTLACYYSNNKVAKYLINHVKDINSKSGFGTPLMAAVVKNNKELVEILIKNKVKLNIADQNQTTALHYAVTFSYIDIVKLLVNAKADSSLKDNRGNSALDYAKLIGNQKIIQLF
jgi:ankyrin repeat protein